MTEQDDLKQQEKKDLAEADLYQTKKDLVEAKNWAKCILTVKKVLNLLVALAVAVSGLVFGSGVGSNRDREFVLIATSSLGALGVFIEAIAKLDDTGKKSAEITVACNLLNDEPQMVEKDFMTRATNDMAAVRTDLQTTVRAKKRAANGDLSRMRVEAVTISLMQLAIAVMGNASRSRVVTIEAKKVLLLVSGSFATVIALIALYEFFSDVTDNLARDTTDQMCLRARLRAVDRPRDEMVYGTADESFEMKFDTVDRIKAEKFLAARKLGYARDFFE